MRFRIVWHDGRQLLCGPFVSPATWWLSAGLSLLGERVHPATAKTYAREFAHFLTRAEATEPDVAALIAGREPAREALLRLLRRCGCGLRFEPRLGVYRVHASHSCIAVALTCLNHLYDIAAIKQRIAFTNPLAADRPWVDPIADGEPRNPPLYFLLTNRPGKRVRTIDPRAGEAMLAAAEHWPEAVRLATHLLVDLGARIGTVLALTVADWAIHGFGLALRASGKGDQNRRDLTLYVDSVLQARLRAYVDGLRREQTGYGLAELTRLAHHHRDSFDHPALQAPLLLNLRGTALTYANFNDTWFRPAMRRLGIPCVPHTARHLYTTRAMTLIEDTAISEADKDNKIEALCALQGWRSGQAMALYYSAPLQHQRAQKLASWLVTAMRQAPVPAPIWSASGRSPSPALADFQRGERS